MARPLKVDPYRYDMEFRSLIIALLKMRKGVGIDLFGLLQIDDQENGHVRVLDQRDELGDISDGIEYAFKDVKDGVDFFMDIREDRRLGYDFDRHLDREFAAQTLEDVENGDILLLDDVE